MTIKLLFLQGFHTDGEFIQDTGNVLMLIAALRTPLQQHFCTGISRISCCCCSASAAESPGSGGLESRRFNHAAFGCSLSFAVSSTAASVWLCDSAMVLPNPPNHSRPHSHSHPLLCFLPTARWDAKKLNTGRGNKINAVWGRWFKAAPTVTLSLFNLSWLGSWGGVQGVG